MTTRSYEPYAGIQRTLVIGIDFGTTFSGVTYTVLDPGLIPQMFSVTRFPGQENGDFKIPSIVCYAADGHILAVGAEARQANIDLDPEEGDPVFVEWFKLHLCPSTLRPEGLGLAPLPPNKSIVQVIADLFAYLFKCTREYIQQTHANGGSLWISLGDRIEVVVSHPNGWGGAQQAKMREAAILARVITDTPVGRARLQFITEGEASFHYCVNSGLASMAVREGSSVMIVDAGGGTVDLTTYKFTTVDPIAVEETALPGCILQGSTQVNARFYTYLRDRLEGSEYNHEDDVNEMLQLFERNTKPTFKDSSLRSFIKFGRLRDTDTNVGIRNGSLIVQGQDLANLFEPAVDGIVAAVRNQRTTSAVPVNIVFLVGGFAASPWLFSNIRDILKEDGVEVYRPDSHTNKVVSEGAVTYFLKKFVKTRVARMTWGFEALIPYREDNPEHYKRRHKTKPDAAGEERLSQVFQLYVSEGTRLTENDVIRHHWLALSDKSKDLDRLSARLKCYRGTQRTPYWMDEDPHSYWSLYSVRADTSGIRKIMGYGFKGIYYKVYYDIVLTVGLTTLRAQIVWKENGVEKWGDAEIIYEES